MLALKHQLSRCRHTSRLTTQLQLPQAACALWFTLYACMSPVPDLSVWLMHAHLNAVVAAGSTPGYESPRTVALTARPPTSTCATAWHVVCTASDLCPNLQQADGNFNDTRPEAHCRALPSVWQPGSGSESELQTPPVNERRPRRRRPHLQRAAGHLGQPEEV